MIGAKRLFTLDESVVIVACTGVDPRGRPDRTCLNLISRIEANCHGLVMGSTFYERYLRQYNALGGRLTVPNAMAPLVASWRNRDKSHRWLQDGEVVDIPGLEQMPNVDVGDREFVRASASVHGSILVTTDEPLIERVRERRLDIAYGFSILLPKDALHLVG